MKKINKNITAEEFDKKFDDGEDIGGYLDLDSARKIHPKAQRLNLDAPMWMVSALDKEAKHIGISRQALIKTWLAEKLEKHV